MDKYDEIIKGPGLRFYYTTDTEQKLADLCRERDGELERAKTEIAKLEKLIDDMVARIKELSEKEEGK